MDSSDGTDFGLGPVVSFFARRWRVVNHYRTIETMKVLLTITILGFATTATTIGDATPLTHRSLFPETSPASDPRCIPTAGSLAACVGVSSSAQ